jgi:xanthine/uracil permease
MLRSIGSVVAGFVFIAIGVNVANIPLRRMMPEAFDANGGTHDTTALLISFVTVAVFAVAGSYLTARLAPNRPMRHALILAAAGLVFNVVSAAMMWGYWPAWYTLISLALVMPYGWLGGRLRERQLEGAVARPALV